MPWRKVKNHEECDSAHPVAVVNADTGRKVGCHTDEASADRQLAALNANVADSNIRRAARR